ncbi:MAG: metal-dependent hydrolase [Acidaminococcaceae bacterium]|nr:metal-dependent hydrolase [Acidaminococcaceae bacterium]
MSAKFHYINHACFTIESNGKIAIFDPFLDGNPEGLQAKDIKADYVFVSHAHFDHIADAYAIAKANKSLVISTAEIAGDAGNNGCQSHGMHLGGTFQFPFGKVRIAMAFHGSGIAGGHACGFVVDFFGTKLYYAGDTALYGDMQLLQRQDAFDYAVLPIGGNFTMDPKDATIAAEFLKAKYVIPVHYNTWPPIKQDVNAYKKEVESTTSSHVLIVKPGETIELK